MSLPAQSVCIIGGGFTGMCAAIQLAKQGVDVDLIEIDENWRTDGAGLTVSGPSMRALAEVGVLEQFRAEGSVNPGLQMFTPDGTMFASLPSLPLPGTDINGSGGIMRPALARILAEETKKQGVSVRLGVTYSSIEQEGDLVHVAFTDGSSKKLRPCFRC